MEYITWPTNVNTNVLDSTVIEIGKGYVEDSSSNGAFSNRRLSSLAMPESYTVVMVFDWNTKDSDGYSEFDRFIRWYKYTHYRGVNPFEFPSISKFETNGTTEVSYYRITGDLSITKSGLAFQVSMKWTEWITEAISIPEETCIVNYISADPTDTEQYIYVNYTSVKSTIPSTTDITFTINGTEQTVLIVKPSYTSANQYKFKVSNDAWDSGEYTIVATYEESDTTVTQTFTMEVD